MASSVHPFPRSVPAVRGGAARLAAVLAMMLTALLLSGAAVAQTALGGVDVVGNRRIEPATIAALLTISPGEPITPEAVNASVRNLFDSGLFRDAAIAVDGNRLVVRVDENPTINRVAFEGNSVVSDDVLRPNITSRPRRAFTRARAEADAQVLTEIYRRSGRFGAIVEPVIIELPDNRVDLVFEIEEGSVTRINAINFIGNETFSNRRLRRVIETTVSGLFAPFLTSDIYDPDRIDFDAELLRRFYLSRGFADFTVVSSVAELSPDRRGFFITFTVEEGERYTFGELSVVSQAPGLDAAEFEALIEGRAGDTYNADLVERTIDRMVFLAGQRGFAFVQVRPRAIRDPVERTIGVVYELVEGPQVLVERIEIEGNIRTLDRVIRRQFELVEGDVFDSRAVERARNNIRATGYFSRVDVDVEPGVDDDSALINVSVEEQATGALTFGIGFSTADGPTGEITLSERNFLGRGQFLQLRTLVAGEQQVFDLTFREPAFLDRDLAVGFNAFYRLEDRSDESSFEETNFGFVPTLSFPVSEFGRVGLTYQISQDEIRDVRDTASPLIAREAGTKITSSVGTSFTYDRRNDPLNPSAGYLVRLGADVAGVGGDARHVQVTALGRAFTAILDEDVVGSIELEVGAIEGFAGDEPRITERFSIGGDQFRGFRRGGIGPRDFATDDALGGKYFAVARTEVTFPLGLPDDLGFSGGVFVDAGTIFGLDRTRAGTSNVDDSAKLRATIGASLFWDSAFGPLRINVATPLVKQSGDQTETFRLTVGTRF